MIARLAVIVVVIAVAAGAWFTVGPGAGPPTGACRPSTSTPVADAPSGPADDPPAVRWQAATIPVGLDDGDEQIVLDVAAFRDGFVVVGRESHGPDHSAFVLRSTDGVSWERRPDDEVRFSRAEMQQLLTVDDRIFGIGSVETDDRGGSRVGVWLSDDGLSWREATGRFDDAYPTSIAAGMDAMLLVGTAAADGVARVWRSTDGESWDTVALELPVPIEFAQLGQTMALGDGWISVGSISRGPDSPAVPVVWRSDDGVAWSCQVLDPGRLPVVRPHALHRSDVAWLALGTGGEVCGPAATCIGYPVAWVSSDGLVWSRAIFEEEPISLGGSAFAGSDAGLVSVSHGATWTSVDGATWFRASDGETSGSLAGQADVLVVTDDGRVVVGGTAYDGASDADPWIATGEVRP